MRGPSQTMPGPSYTLNKTVDLTRRHILNDKIDRSNIDAQLQCARANESLDLAGLECFLRSDPFFFRKRPVVDHYVLAHQIELRTQHLRIDPTVDKDQSRIMRINKIRHECQPCGRFGGSIQASCEFLILLAGSRILNLVPSILA